MGEQETLEWQFSRISSLESAFRDYLKEAPAQLLACVASTKGAYDTKKSEVTQTAAKVVFLDRAPGNVRF